VVADVLSIPAMDTIRDIENCGSLVKVIGDNIFGAMALSEEGVVVFASRVIGNIYNQVDSLSKAGYVGL